MGAWGFGVFDNDSSCDFVMELSEAENITERIKETFENVISETEYIDVDNGSAAWVCICVLDQILNGVSYDCPDIEYDEIIERADKSELETLKDYAVKSVDCILSDISELRELIEECEDKDYNNWRNSIITIKNKFCG